ncbi:hypothetical protein BDV96DRAFT_668363 [Lophiotrema nucula]|uniref:Uncharacterized protein n=1 Tax=Lophiotrema nucula TaxID=690887 RepID=A0A6A5ZR53_9PLEO|nr:hypothetical protein BDV96DRAFT_668363 [Lophiotrema nucula]
MLDLLILATTFLTRFASSKPIELNARNASLPVSIRECFLAGTPSAAITPFVSWLADQPPATVSKNMGWYQSRYNSSGTCMQVQIYNQSCDTDLNITGPSISNAVQSIADQCDGFVYDRTSEVCGPTGFGYYKDLDTGRDYTNHLWVVTGQCGNGSLKSACSPGS